jgi:hypothetical protein
MTKLLARLRYDGQHHRCRAPRCLRVARHRAGTCTPTPAAVEMVAEGAR